MGRGPRVVGGVCPGVGNKGTWPSENLKTIKNLSPSALSCHQVLLLMLYNGSDKVFHPKSLGPGTPHSGHRAFSCPPSPMADHGLPICWQVEPPSALKEKAQAPAVTRFLGSLRTLPRGDRGPVLGCHPSAATLSGHEASAAGGLRTLCGPQPAPAGCRRRLMARGCLRDYF